MKTKFFSVILSAALALTAMPGRAAKANEPADGSAESGGKTYEDFFVKDNIIDINIEIRDEDLLDMYDYAVNEEYHSADITIDGVKVENAGIRTKGNMTLTSVASSDSDRYSFRIKFNKYVKGQTFLGLDELCLNNCYSDATYMREYLHYELLEELGMNVPMRSYCNVYINGELFGFYLAVEGLDDTFLEREFGKDYENGNLYKMDMGSTLEYREDETYTYADHKLGADTDLAEFKSFVKKLNSITDGEKGDTESFLNVESALKYIASNTVLCNYDSYNGNNHHNFYLYEDEQGVFTVIPWDFNMSFGGFNGSNSTVGIDTPIISGSLETLPLIGKLLSIDDYKEQYYGYIKELMSMLEDFEKRVTELKELIRPYVENDPTAFYTAEEFEISTTLQADEANKDSSSTEDDSFGRDSAQPFGGTDSIINCIADRLENLNAQFDGTAAKTTETSESFGGGEAGFAPPGDAHQPQGKPPSDMELAPDVQPSEDGDLRDFPQEPPQDADFSGFPGGGAPHDQQSAQPSTAIRVHIDGHIVTFDTDPLIENDTTLVGFRAVLEALGAEVTWDDASESVTAVKDDIVIVLTVGSDTAYVNGEAYTLLAAPVIVDDSVLVPVRFLAERFGLEVSWNGETRLITVSSK